MLWFDGKFFFVYANCPNNNSSNCFSWLCGLFFQHAVTYSQNSSTGAVVLVPLATGLSMVPFSSSTGIQHVVALFHQPSKDYKVFSLMPCKPKTFVSHATLFLAHKKENMIRYVTHRKCSKVDPEWQRMTQWSNRLTRPRWRSNRCCSKWPWPL